MFNDMMINMYMYVCDQYVCVCEYMINMYVLYDDQYI